MSATSHVTDPTGGASSSAGSATMGSGVTLATGGGLSLIGIVGTSSPTTGPTVRSVMLTASTASTVKKIDLVGVCPDDLVVGNGHVLVLGTLLIVIV